MRVRPEAVPVMEAQEVRGTCGVDLVGPVRDDGEDGGVASDLCGLGGG